MTTFKVVHGSPGSGKTRYLTDIVTEHEGKEVLVLSFSRAAAQEITHRMPTAKASTIHALCLSLLKDAGRLSDSPLIDATTCEEFNRRTPYTLVFEPNEPSTENEILTATLLGVYDYSRNHGIPITRAFNQVKPRGIHTAREVLDFATVFEDYLKANGLVTFHDLIERALKLNPGMFKVCDVLMVDEAQDLSTSQWAVCNAIANFCEVVYVVGDADQSIFQWAGAAHDGMRAWSEQHNAEVSIMQKGYRVPERIHRQTQKLVNVIKNRLPKDVTPVKSGGLFYASHGGVMRLAAVDRHVPTGILCRTAFVLKEAASWLVGEGIPFQTSARVPCPMNNLFVPATTAYEKYMDGSIKSMSPSHKKYMTDTFGVTFLEERVPLKDGWFLDVVRNSRYGLWDVHKMIIRNNIKRMVNLTTEIDLSTIHSSKGKEWHTVYLFTKSGSMIHNGEKRNPDAEARVWFVGATRAKEVLHVIRHAHEPRCIAALCS